jgi:hypothetical protein
MLDSPTVSTRTDDLTDMHRELSVRAVWAVVAGHAAYP